MNTIFYYIILLNIINDVACGGGTSEKAPRVNIFCIKHLLCLGQIYCLAFHIHVVLQSQDRLKIELYFWHPVLLAIS